MTKPKASPKPRGGKREGAGRPEGSADSVERALPRGAIVAVKAMRHRVPDGLPPGLADVADSALERLVAVMNGKVSPDMANAVLTASRAVREELCGPVPKKLEHSGPNGQALTVSINLTRAAPSSAAPVLPNHEDAGRPPQEQPE